MATDEVVYLTYTEAALAHIELMRYLGETRYGVFDRALVESALARPRHAARYEGADLLAQAATLLFGLIKNHPWVGGNTKNGDGNHARISAAQSLQALRFECGNA